MLYPDKLLINEYTGQNPSLYHLKSIPPDDRIRMITEQRLLLYARIERCFNCMKEKKIIYLVDFYLDDDGNKICVPVQLLLGFLKFYMEYAKSHSEKYKFNKFITSQLITALNLYISFYKWSYVTDFSDSLEKYQKYASEIFFYEWEFEKNYRLVKLDNEETINDIQVLTDIYSIVLSTVGLMEYMVVKICYILMSNCRPTKEVLKIVEKYKSATLYDFNIPINISDPDPLDYKNIHVVRE